MDHIGVIIEVIQSGVFRRWLDDLRDRRAVARINVRLRNVTLGRFGDVAPVGDGVSEMRIHYGPGYRPYFVRRGPAIIVLLCGGDKDSQQRDIRRARTMAPDWR